MLKQIGQSIRFAAFFSASKVGKTGLTVTCDIYKNSAVHATGVSATEGAGGLYSYTLPGASVDVAGNYICIFKTTDASVDLQHMPSYFDVGENWVERIDETTSAAKNLIGTAGANLTAIGDTRLAKLDANISTVGTLAANAILVNPANKLFTNASNQVTVGGLGSTAIQAIWEIPESTVFANGTLGAKFKAWTMGTDGRALISANAHTSSATVASVSNSVTVSSINANAITGNSLADTAITKIQNGLAVPGSAMTLTSGAQTSLVGAIELELMNDATGGAFMQAVANKLAQEFDIENLTLIQIATTTRDYILNRVLAGNHDTPGTPGKLLQTAATSAGVSSVGAVLGDKIDDLHDLSPSQVADALNAYDAPTRSELTQDKLEIINSIPSDGSGGNAPTKEQNAEAVRAILTDAVLSNAAAAGVLINPDHKIDSDDEGAVLSQGPITL